jgi:hypothetical protein
MIAEDIVKDSCTWIGGGIPFHLASLDWFNDVADSVTDWPVCLMDNECQERPVITTIGAAAKQYDITLLFLHSYPKNDAEDLNHNPSYGGVRHTAVDTMRSLAEALLDTLIKDTRIMKPSEAITGPVIRNVYNFMDANLDGVELRFTLTMQRVPNCPPKHDGPKP